MVNQGQWVFSIQSFISSFASLDQHHMLCICCWSTSTICYALRLLSIVVVRIHAPLGTGHKWSATASQIVEPCASSVEPSQKSAFVLKLAGIHDFILLWMHRSGVAINFVLTLVGRPVFYLCFEDPDKIKHWNSRSIDLPSRLVASSVYVTGTYQLALCHLIIY
jgi:hypothetical protein